MVMFPIGIVIHILYTHTVYTVEHAWFLLLEHQRVFESSVIDAYESLSRPRCEKMDLRLIQYSTFGRFCKRCIQFCFKLYIYCI